METPSLSVILPNYNHSAYLPRALDALLAQTVQPMEMIVIDDCSTDDSLAVAKGWIEKNGAALKHAALGQYEQARSSIDTRIDSLSATRPASSNCSRG